MAANQEKTADTGRAKSGPVRFSKEQILSFQRYRGRRDLLSVLLKDGEAYTQAQADAIIEGFMKTKGKVKK